MAKPIKHWSNRIVGHGEEDPTQLLANPKNWRLHPKAQQDALAGVLDEVGWVAEVIVNRTTGHVVDGHLRVGLAISRQERAIPVRYVELTEAEEALVLASLDPISAMASRDMDQLQALLSEVVLDPATVESMFGDAGMFDVDAMGAPELPTGDRAGFRQMSFIVSDEQAEVITDAIARAKAVGPFDSDNRNGNGNALARIAETYCGLG